MKWSVELRELLKEYRRLCKLHDRYEQMGKIEEADTIIAEIESLMKDIEILQIAKEV